MINVLTRPLLDGAAPFGYHFGYGKLSKSSILVTSKFTLLCMFTWGGYNTCTNNKHNNSVHLLESNQ